MNTLFLTQYGGAILGPIAKLLGLLMNGIYYVLEKIGIPNIGLAIILFTIVIYMLLLPLTIRQQKFSKLQSKMAPELKAIQDKYKNRKDQDAMLAQQEEMKMVYAKYGVSQTGSCLQLLIQMPILLALYQVINAIPAYVTSVKNVFVGLANQLITAAGSSEIMQSLSGAARYTSQFANENFTAGVVNEYTTNTYIDVLNKASSADWQVLTDSFPDLSSVITSTHEQINHLNNFLGLNIGESPSNLLSSAWDEKSFILILAAIAVPVLSALTQFINVKMMPQQAPASNDPNDQTAAMQRQMQTMNTIMPLMSAFFCFTLPAGMGIYWISGSVIRTVQQIFINHHIDRMDIDAVIEKNKEKYQEKLQKSQERTANMQQYAHLNNRNASALANVDTSAAPSQNGKSKNAELHYSSMSEEERNAALEKAMSYYNSGNARPDSLLYKANLVKKYDEEHSNKKK